MCECECDGEPRQGGLSPADSPLMLMERAGCLEGVRLLLSYKADPGRVNKARRGGRGGEGQEEAGRKPERGKGRGIGGKDGKRHTGGKNGVGGDGKGVRQD